MTFFSWYNNKIKDLKIWFLSIFKNNQDFNRFIIKRENCTVSMLGELLYIIINTYKVIHLS